MTSGMYKRTLNKKYGMSGKNHKEITKEKIRQKLEGRKLLEKTKKKISRGMLGKKHTEETKEKIRKAATGKCGPKSGRWKGGSGLTDDGYKWILKKNHPNAMKSGYVLEHRYVMSKYIGRPLKKNELVHHKNQNKLDNRISNLKIIIKKREFHNDTIKCPYCNKKFSIQ